MARLSAVRGWLLRALLGAGMALGAVWVANRGVAGVALSAVVHTMVAVDLFHLAVLGLIWAAGLSMYSVVLSAAMPGLGARRTLAVNLAGSAVANSVPLGGALAGALNWRMLSGWGHSNAAFVAYSTVTHILAVLTKLALPVVAVGCLVLASEHVPVALWCAAAGCAGALVLTAAAAVWLSLRSTGSRTPRLHRWTRRVAAFCAGSGDQIVSIVRRRWAWLMAGSAAYTAAQVLLLGACLHAVGLNVPITVLVAAAAIERLGTIIPFTPGGAGIAEIGTIAWLITTGLDPTLAVAGVVLYRTFVVVMEIPVGGAVLAGWAWANRGQLWERGWADVRIAHVSDVYLPALGGIELHVADLARRQADRGDEVTVLTFNADMRDRVDNAQSDGGVEVTRLPSLAAGMAVDLGAFDAVHAHVSSVSPLASTLASQACRKGVPTVATVHSLWQGLGALPAVSAAAFGLRSAPVAWTAVSEIAAEGVERWLPAGRRVEVLPNAADVAARAETPLRGVGEPVTIVSTMRLARLKRPLPLLRMFARVSKLAAAPVRLTLIGDGGQRRAVEVAVRAFGLGDSVRLTGRLDRESVLRLVAESDVYVAPAPLESFGLAALEARCVGLPVVAMAASGVGDFVRHAENGLLADSDADMVRLLAHLADDPAARFRIAEHNRCTVSGFGWSESLERTDLAYDRAVAVAGASPRSRRWTSPSLPGWRAR